MIKITGRKLHIPQSDKILGFEGDNLCETRCFLITDTSLFGLSFKLDVLEYNCCIDLEKEEMDGGELLTWNITSGITQNSGILNVQLRGFDTQNELVWHSEIETFFVGDSVNASKTIENVALTEFEQIEKRATQSKNQAADFAISAKEYAEMSEGYKNDCVEYAKECEENAKAFSDILDIHKQDTSNPHNVTAEQVGAYTKQQIDSTLTNPFEMLRNRFNNHESSGNNPHNVTAEQVGAYTKEECDSTASMIMMNVNAHKSSEDNPHRVTASQVGAYTKSETDSKIDNIGLNLFGHTTNTDNPHKVTAEQVGAYSKSEIDEIIGETFKLEYKIGGWYNSNGKAKINAGQTAYHNTIANCEKAIGKTIHISTHTVSNLPIFVTDADMNILETYATTTGNPNLEYSVDIVIPENAVYICVTCWSYGTYFVEIDGLVASVADKLDELNGKIKEFEDIINDTGTAIVPTNNRIPVVGETVLYLDNVLQNYNIEKVHRLEYNNAYLKLYDNRLFYFAPTTAMLGNQGCKVDISNLTENHETLTFSFLMTAMADITEETTVECLFIGDSITENGSYLIPLNSLCNEDNLKITFLGTREKNGIRHEGRSGWAAYNYVSDNTFGTATNAFWNPTTNAFDFSYYLTQNGIETPDVVFINLGTNDMIRGITDTTNIDEITSVVTTSYNTMINSIKAVNGDIKIVLWLPPTRSLVGSNQRKGIYNALRANKILIDTFDTKANINNGVYLMPTYLYVDPYSDYKETEVVINGKTYKEVTDAIHPAQETGGLHIAKGIMSQIKYVLSL